MQHPVPGGWVDFPTADDVTSGQRKAFIRRLRASDVDNLEKTDLSVMSFLTGWSFDLPLPTADNNTLDGLTTRTVDAIHSIAGDLLKAITPNFQPNPDPKSPTEPSTV